MTFRCIFDADGVLVNSRAAAWTAAAQIMSLFGDIRKRPVKAPVLY